MFRSNWEIIEDQTPTSDFAIQPKGMFIPIESDVFANNIPFYPI